MWERYQDGSRKEIKEKADILEFLLMLSTTQDPVVLVTFLS
jgi:hypothetical protein